MNHVYHTYYKPTILPQKCNSPDIIKYYPKKSKHSCPYKPNQNSTSKSVYSYGLSYSLILSILLISNMSSLLESRNLIYLTF